MKGEERGMREWIQRKWSRMMRWTGSGKKEMEPSVDEQMRNLGEEMAEMSLRVERLEKYAFGM